MSHLVEPIKETTLLDCYERVRAAHKYLSKHGRAAVPSLNRFPDTQWGIRCKRVSVELPVERPADIGRGIVVHSLVEIINQCATMERLLAALEWVQGDTSKLSDYRVECCNPTTSGGGNDLVLCSSSGEKALFEISDVASDRDGNKKEEKSLVRLGVLKKGEGKERMDIEHWPHARLFLVVSSEFGEKLASRKRAWLTGHCRYECVGTIESTLVFEILCGSK